MLEGQEMKQQINLLKERCWTERVVGEEWKEPENQTSKLFTYANRRLDGGLYSQFAFSIVVGIVSRESHTLL